MHHVSGYASQLLCSGVVAKCLGTVERVFAEFLADLGLTLLDGGKALFGCAYQISAAQFKSAHGVAVGLCLLGVQRGHVHGFVLGVQALVRA